MTPRARITIALRAVLAATLVVLGAGAIVRVVASAFDPFHPYPGHASDYGIARTRAIRAALPDIAERPQQTVVVLGSSGVARAFVPSAFDAAFDAGRGRYVSFNLAQLLLQPETALSMAKVIRRTYEAHHKRIGIVVFAVSVPELSRGSLRAARQKMPEQAFAFTTVEQLEERMHTDPSGAAEDAAEYALYGNVHPDQVGLWVKDWWNDRPPPCDSGMKQPPEGEEAMNALVAYCNELHGQFPRGVPPWNPDTRGAFDFGLPATRPMLEGLVTLQPVPPPPPAAPKGASVPDDTDEEAVRTTIAALRELSAVSDHTIVLADIMNPAFVGALPPELVTRWRDTTERIAHEGDARLLDFNDGTFVARDFGDRTHLHALAAQRFSELLAARLKPMVGEHRASR